MGTSEVERALAEGPGWPAGLAPRGPLGGVRVLDLSRVLAGPYCCMVLADLGADVLEVERPGVGDDTRHWGPPFHGTDAAYFLSVNRDRRSVALDLTSAAARAVVRRLASAAQVVVENVLPRHLEALGWPRCGRRPPPCGCPCGAQAVTGRTPTSRGTT